jgi:hypothetical protein
MLGVYLTKVIAVESAPKRDIQKTEQLKLLHGGDG